MTSKEMSAYLMTRLIHPETSNTITTFFPKRTGIKTSAELLEALQDSIHKDSHKCLGLALSGGIDSAILAKLVPKGTIAYTFKCIVPGINTYDETAIASEYATENGLDHRIVEISWDDVELLSSELMKHKKAPIHSIEVQIYKAALQAKADGCDALLFGEAADAIYGGQSNILSRDYFAADFIERYAYIMPHRVLREPCYPLEVFMRHEREGKIDPFEFMSQEYINESVGSYINACETAGIDYVLPYANTKMSCPIDYARIRKGENKYIVREVFRLLYPDYTIPEKLPMPRAVNEWFANWKGPTRSEFIPGCIEFLNGDQRWLVWCLERYLNQCV